MPLKALSKVAIYAMIEQKRVNVEIIAFYIKTWSTFLASSQCLRKSNPVALNPLTAAWALRALIDFTLSNARRFYSSMGNPLDGKGLKR